MTTATVSPPSSPVPCVEAMEEQEEDDDAELQGNDNEEEDASLPSMEMLLQDSPNGEGSKELCLQDQDSLQSSLESLEGPLSSSSSLPPPPLSSSSSAFEPPVSPRTLRRQKQLEMDELVSDDDEEDDDDDNDDNGEDQEDDGDSSSGVGDDHLMELEDDIVDSDHEREDHNHNHKQQQQLLEAEPVTDHDDDITDEEDDDDDDEDSMEFYYEEVLLPDIVTPIRKNWKYSWFASVHKRRLEQVSEGEEESSASESHHSEGSMSLGGEKDEKSKSHSNELNKSWSSLDNHKRSWHSQRSLARRIRDNDSDINDEDITDIIQGPTGEEGMDIDDDDDDDLLTEGQPRSPRNGGLPKRKSSFKKQRKDDDAPEPVELEKQVQSKEAEEEHELNDSFRMMRRTALLKAKEKVAAEKAKKKKEKAEKKKVSSSKSGSASGNGSSSPKKSKRKTSTSNNPEDATLTSTKSKSKRKKKSKSSSSSVTEENTSSPKSPSKSKRISKSTTADGLEIVKRNRSKSRSKRKTPKTAESAEDQDAGEGSTRSSSKSSRKLKVDPAGELLCSPKDDQSRSTHSSTGKSGRRKYKSVGDSLPDSPKPRRKSKSSGASSTDGSKTSSKSSKHKTSKSRKEMTTSEGSDGLTRVKVGTVSPKSNSTDDQSRSSRSKSRRKMRSKSPKNRRGKLPEAIEEMELPLTSPDDGDEPKRRGGKRPHKRGSGSHSEHGTIDAAGEGSAHSDERFFDDSSSVDSSSVVSEGNELCSAIAAHSTRKGKKKKSSSSSKKLESVPERRSKGAAATSASEAEDSVENSSPPEDKAKLREGGNAHPGVGSDHDADPEESHNLQAVPSKKGFRPVQKLAKMMFTKSKKDDPKDSTSMEDSEMLGHGTKKSAECNEGGTTTTKKQHGFVRNFFSPTRSLLGGKKTTGDKKGTAVRAEEKEASLDLPSNDETDGLEAGSTDPVSDNGSASQRLRECNRAAEDAPSAQPLTDEETGEETIDNLQTKDSSASKKGNQQLNMEELVHALHDSYTKLNAGFESLSNTIHSLSKGGSRDGSQHGPSGDEEEEFGTDVSTISATKSSKAGFSTLKRSFSLTVADRPRSKLVGLQRASSLTKIKDGENLRPNEKASSRPLARPKSFFRLGNTSQSG